MSLGKLEDKVYKLAAKEKGGVRQGEVDSRFRGTWQLASKTPTFNAFQFLPTPPPQKPRLVPPTTVEECTEEVIYYTQSTDDILDRPPDGVDVLCTIKDRYSNYRGYIAKDGECRNNVNQLLGYINADSGECGSADQEFLGFLENVSEFDDSNCVIKDAIDEIAAFLDLGNGYIRDSNNRIVAEISHNGICTGHSESYLGEFEGFNFHYMKIIAIYLILLDPGMLNEVEG